MTHCDFYACSAWLPRALLRLIEAGRDAIFSRSSFLLFFALEGYATSLLVSKLSDRATRAAWQLSKQLLSYPPKSSFKAFLIDMPTSAGNAGPSSRSNTTRPRLSNNPQTAESKLAELISLESLIPAVAANYLVPPLSVPFELLARA